ncbi:MAG: hypothetical protein HGB32_07910 [Geobacteraceae bacterium]|nr:hypothetical protein [Geobacteraceae bacterium]
MKKYHLFLLLKTVHEAGPAEDLLSLGFTPGQFSKLIIEATRDGLLVRKKQNLWLSETGIAQLNLLLDRGGLICPDGQWIKTSKDAKLDSTEETGIYVPRPKKNRINRYGCKNV